MELECALSKPMLSVEPIYGDYNSTIDQIIFTNSGGPAEDFQIQVFPCFRFYFSGVESSPEETIRFEQHDLITFVPIHNGNFPICYVTNVNSTYGSVGSVITTPYISQCHAVMDSASNRHGLYQTVSLEYFIIVSYQDIYKADYEQYYHCVTGHYSDSPDAHIKGLPLPRFTSLSPDDELHDYLKSLSEENDIQMYYPIWNNNIDEEVDSIFNILKETTYGWAID
ncbi:MAG: hypothetical protein E7451_02845 [Ruminococcaceae bacterium]|nr:hypothetical protein [Oscillospiraceae bacterium]